MAIFPFKEMAKTRVTCPYGIKGTHWKSGKHDGVDLVASGDKTVLAVSTGRVIRSDAVGSWGQHVVIQIPDGRAIVYAHLITGSQKVKVGDAVKAGQPLGVMGNSGNSTGPHLHIELQKKYYKAGATDDITKYLRIKNIVGAADAI